MVPLPSIHRAATLLQVSKEMPPAAHIRALPPSGQSAAPAAGPLPWGILPHFAAFLPTPRRLQGALLPSDARPSPPRGAMLPQPVNKCSSVQAVCPSQRGGRQAMLSRNAQTRGSGLGGEEGWETGIKISGEHPEVTQRRSLCFLGMLGPHVPPLCYHLLSLSLAILCDLPPQVNTKDSLSPDCLFSTKQCLFQGWCSPWLMDIPRPTKGYLTHPQQ